MSCILNLLAEVCFQRFYWYAKLIKKKTLLQKKKSSAALLKKAAAHNTALQLSRCLPDSD